MFLQRQKLDVRETIFHGIVSEQRRHLAVTKRAIVFFAYATPGSKVDFVNRKWLTPRLTFGSLCQPRSIAKLVIGFEDDGRSVRRHFGHQSVRIGLKEFVSGGVDGVFVKLTRAQ